MLTFTALIASLTLLTGVVVIPVARAQESMATPAAAPGQAAAVTVKVEVGDFFVKPETTDLGAGTPYRFEVTNTGTNPHEFVIEPAGKVDEPLETDVQGKEVEAEIEDIAPGVTKELIWTFDQPGDYQMACHVPGHFEAGMKTGFTVGS